MTPDPRAAAERVAAEILSLVNIPTFDYRWPEYTTLVTDVLLAREREAAAELAALRSEHAAVAAYDAAVTHQAATQAVEALRAAHAAVERGNGGGAMSERVEIVDRRQVQAIADLIARCGVSSPAALWDAALHVYDDHVIPLEHQRAAAEAERDACERAMLALHESVIAAAARIRELETALNEHACIERPEEGFTKARYPEHSCWAALTPPGAGGE